MAGGPEGPYFRQDLAQIFDRGFGFHAELVAAGILELLEPVRAAGGTVLELGCGTGALTGRLVAAGHTVIATDASPAMLELARDNAPGADVRRLTLPDDPIPSADAIVAVGHPFNYLPDAISLRRGLLAAAAALRPGGLFAVDVADLQWAQNATVGQIVKVADDWAWINRVSAPRPDLYLREMTTFVRLPDGSWRRDDERHENVLVNTTEIPGWLAEAHVDARVSSSFGIEVLPNGLKAIIGYARA